MQNSTLGWSVTPCTQPRHTKFSSSACPTGHTEPRAITHLRASSSHRPPLCEQATRAAGDASEQGAGKARVQAQKHQEAVARLTGDNLVLMLKLRQSEAAAIQAATQRDSLASQLEQQKGPWFQQVRLSSAWVDFTREVHHAEAEGPRL